MDYPIILIRMVFGGVYFTGRDIIGEISSEVISLETTTQKVNFRNQK